MGDEVVVPTVVEQPVGVKKSRLWIWIVVVMLVVIAVFVLVFMLGSGEVVREPADDSTIENESAEDGNEVVNVASSETQCGSDVYNCANFSSHDEAQAVFEFCGGPGNDVHRLDGDKDGIACGALK